MKPQMPSHARGMPLGPVGVLLLAVAFILAGAAVSQNTDRGMVLADVTPVVRFDPSPVEVGWGMTRNVNVVVENIQGLYAIEMRIAFPNSLVQVVDADPSVPGVQIQDGSVFDGFDTYPIQNSVDNSTGLIEYIISITGSDTGMVGSGVLATIPLHSAGLGNAVLSFVEIILCERDGTRIPLDIGTGQTPINVVTTTSTPTSTPGGVAPSPQPTSTFTPGPSPTNVSPAEVYVVPATQDVALGNTDIVQIEVRNAWDLYGFDIRLDYNGGLLDIEDADPALVTVAMEGVNVYMGDVFDGFSYQVLQNEVLDDGIFGQVHFVAYINSGLPLGFCGDGVMFWLVFRGVAPGTSAVTLSEVTLVDHAGTSIARNLHHGQVNVLSGGASATPTRTPSATFTFTPGPSPTVTLTATPTPTGTVSSPTPSPTQTPGGVLVTPTPVCSDEIRNGGFETIVGSEAPPWVRSGSASYTTVEQHTGVRSAWLGGYNNANDKVHQDVAIPSPAGPGEQVTQALLTYWWGMVTDEQPNPFDFMYVRIRNTNGQLLQELESINNTSTSGTWQQSQFDLSAYQGQTVRISFEAVTDASNMTSFYVDDVSLIICQILQPTPTATPTDTPTISPTPTETGLPTATPTITPTPITASFQYQEGVYETMVDSYLTSWDATTNYGHQGALSIRTDGVKRPVLKFDVSSIPSGVTILDARLWLYTSHYKSHTQNLTVDVYGLKRSWTEMQTTWNLAATGVNWGAGGADDTSADRDATSSASRVVSATNTWYNWDITALTQAWINHTRDNYGMVLVGSGNTVEMSFWASEYSTQNLRPKLVIQYTYGSISTPTNTPAISATPGASPTPTLTSTPGQELIYQQGTSGYTGVTDTYISQWQPTTNYGDNVTMLVRQGDVRGTLVRFDLASLPGGITIQQAQLELYALSRSNAGNLTVEAYRVIRPWAEGQATWNLATTSTSWGVAGCNQEGTDRTAALVDSTVVNTVNAWHTWDITSAVQQWVASPGTNRGVILKGAGATSVEYSYVASEYWWSPELTPRLVIQYSTP